MTDHLPEEWRTDEYVKGYTAAVQAARDAVAALLDEFPNPDFQIANAAIHTALAAIDALKEKP